MLEFNKNIDHWKVPSKLSAEDSWAQIQAKLDLKPEAKVIPLYRKYAVAVSIAASLALLIAFTFFLGNSSTQFETVYGQKEKVILPDGSYVLLNAGSSIAFDAGNWENERKIELKGEAFFEVIKGSQFVVNSNHGSVTVLGTSFNIIDREGRFQVACKTGKVKVSHDGQNQILTPGLRTTLEDERLSNPANCQVNEIDEWFFQDVYHFDNVPLENAFAELERQFNISINADNILNGLLVDADVSLEDPGKALDILCGAFNLSYDNSSKNNYTIKLKK